MSANLGFPEDRIRGSIDDDRDSLDFRDDDNAAEDEKELLEEDDEVHKLMKGSKRSRASKSKAKLQRLLGVEDAYSDATSSEKTEHDQQAGGSRKIRGMARRRDGDGSSVQLMHDMEDGAERSSTEASEVSSEADRQELSKTVKSSKSKRSFFGRLTAIHIVIFLAFAGLLYGAYAASKKLKNPLYKPQALSNGTTVFQATTILISLDGFRADFLHRGITPNLNALIADGLSPPYMLPSFPSVTFPNHFTLVTGLYPESHSVVGNTFWDPALQEEFYYTDPARSMQPRFWLADPIWTTAEAAGIPAAIHMWPGSEAHIGTHEPTFVDVFNAKEALEAKADRIFSFLDMPEQGSSSQPSSSAPSRPQLIAAYVPNVDADGHKYGPNSTEIRATIASADAMIGSIMTGLAARSLSTIVNLVVVSDHGMATTSTTRLIQLDKLIDMTQIEHTDGWPLYGLRPKPGVDLDALYHKLKNESLSSSGSFEVYLRDVDMPARYHFSNNPRIAPLWMIPAPGWAIVTKEDFDVDAAHKDGTVYHPRGLHGYDHEHPLMRAIFVARGPAFPHPKGSRVKPFQNVEVYGLVCDSLGLERRPNNGTLTLPLRVEGLHTGIGEGNEEEDLPGDEALAEMGKGTQGKSDKEEEEGRKGWEQLQEMPNSPGKVTDLEIMPTILPDAGMTGLDVNGTILAANETTSTPSEGEDLDRKKSWWKWLKEEAEKIKDWAASPFVSHNGEGPQNGTAPDRPVLQKTTADSRTTATVAQEAPTASSTEATTP